MSNSAPFHPLNPHVFDRPPRRGLCCHLMTWLLTHGRFKRHGAPNPLADHVILPLEVQTKPDDVFFCIHVCVYIYTYMYNHIYIYIYINEGILTHTHTSRFDHGPGPIRILYCSAMVCVWLAFRSLNESSSALDALTADRHS